eukprot:8913025-Pyramimonas_sp.AAC.1
MLECPWLCATPRGQHGPCRTSPIDRFRPKSPPERVPSSAMRLQFGERLDPQRAGGQPRPSAHGNQKYGARGKGCHRPVAPS